MPPAGVSASGQQHVQMYRKVLLRKRLLRWAEPGAVYVPFIGDGDIAYELYNDRRIYGADLDPDRVRVAQARLSDAKVRIADCDVWTFPGLEDRISICDFDAYVDPYKGFRAFWAHHEDKADRMVMFFTDGRRQGLMRSGHWTKPDGTKVLLDGPEKHPVFNAYLTRHVWPWFEAHIEPWVIVDRFRYLRAMMLYWGVVVERRD
jgi:hypothetical protein